MIRVSRQTGYLVDYPGKETQLRAETETHLGEENKYLDNHCGKMLKLDVRRPKNGG